MSELNYTKGEWEIRGDNQGCKVIEVKTLPLFVVEEIGFTTGINNENQDLANANLIASAPDCYEALKELFNQVEANITPSLVTLEKCFKAIAKAEGK
jgi:hypothetical protein